MLRRTLDRYAHHFHKGGKLERFYPLYDAADTFLYTPATVTDPAAIREIVSAPISSTAPAPSPGMNPQALFSAPAPCS